MKQILLFFLVVTTASFTSCYDFQKERASNFNNQPVGSDAENSPIYGEVSGPYLDEMTVPVRVCGYSDAYARYVNKDEATKMLRMINEHKQVGVELKLIQPVWYDLTRIEYKIVRYWEITAEQPCPCDSAKLVRDTIYLPTPEVQKEKGRSKSQDKIEIKPEKEVAPAPAAPSPGKVDTVAVAPKKGGTNMFGKFEMKEWLVRVPIINGTPMDTQTIDISMPEMKIPIPDQSVKEDMSQLKNRPGASNSNSDAPR